MYTMIEKDDFIEEYAKKCRSNDAALFVGAGVSCSTGLPSWKELFKPLAKEINIDLDETEYQLYDIAQFYSNSKGSSCLKKAISERIKNFNDESESLNEVTNMQCSSIWTTNFDKSIENNFQIKNQIQF